MTNNKSWKVQAILCCLNCLKATLQNSEPTFSNSSSILLSRWCHIMQPMDYNNWAAVYSHFCTPGQGHFWSLWLQEGVAAAQVPRLSCGGSPPSGLVMRLLPGGGLRSWSYCRRGTSLWVMPWSWVCCVLSCSSCQALGASETNNVAPFAVMSGINWNDW